MKPLKQLLLTGVLLFTSNAFAAHVECLISGTPTQQTFTADYCASAVNSTPGVVFRFVSSKTVAEVQWSFTADGAQQRNCGTGSQCSVTFRNAQPGREYQVPACVTKILYTDGTWESASYCATGSFVTQGGTPSY